MKANKIVKRSFLAEKKRTNSNRRYNSTGKRRVTPSNNIYNYNRIKKFDSLENNDRYRLNLIRTKTNRDNFVLIKRLNNNFSHQKYNAEANFDQEKLESYNITSFKIKKPKVKKKKPNKKINKNLLFSFEVVSESFFSIPSKSNKNTFNISDTNTYLLNTSKYKKEKEYENSNEEEKGKDKENGEKIESNSINKSYANNKEDEKDEDKDDINYLYRSISNIKKFENNIAETIKNRLKSKLISLTDDLKNENDEEKLKYYIGPIDLSLISLKGNIRESIEDFKNKLNERGFELENDNNNENNNQIKYKKDGIIYTIEVVKIRSNLLYYLIIKDNKN